MRVHTKNRNKIIAALAAAALLCLPSPGASAASYVFATHNHSPTNGAGTPINPATNTVTGSQINVGADPNLGAAVTPDGKYLYVANSGSGTVTEIETSKFTKRTVTVGNQPWTLAVTPDGKKVYVANANTNGATGSVSVISTGSATTPPSVIKTITTGIGAWPQFVAITPDSSQVYVTNNHSNTVSVINTATDSVITGTGYPISVGANPTGIAITPDGTQAYVANSGSTTVSVINISANSVSTITGVASGASVFPFTAAVNPAGTKVYIGVQGPTPATNKIAVINPATNTVTNNITAVGGSVAMMAFTADGQTAYVAQQFANTLFVVNAVTDTVITGTGYPITIPGFGGGVAITPPSSSGPLAYLSNLADGTVSIINTATKAVVATPSVGGSSYNPVGVAISPDGQQVYVTDFAVNGVSVFDTANNTLRTGTGYPIAAGTNPEGIAVSPDGTLALVANNGTISPGTVSVLDLTASPPVGKTGTGYPIAVGNNPIALAFAPNGKTALVANSSANTVSVIDMTTNPPAAKTGTGYPIAVGTTPQGIAITPQGDTALVVNSGANNVSVIDLTATPPAARTGSGYPIPVGTSPWGVAISPDGTTAYVANTGASPGTVSVIDLTASPPSVSHTITVGTNPIGVAFTPDGKYVYVANKGSNTAKVIDTSTFTVVATINVGNQPYAFGLYIQPARSVAYIPNLTDGTLSVLNTTTNAVVAAPTVGASSYNPVGVAVTPDGKQVYVTDFAINGVSVFDTATNKLRTGTGYPISTGISTNPEGIAISPDGSTALVTNNGTTGPGYVSVVDLTANPPVGKNGTGYPVTVGNTPLGVTFAPDGQTAFITNSGSNTVSVLDMTVTPPVAKTGTGYPITVGSTPMAVAVTPDGKTALVTNQGGNSVSVIDLTTSPPTVKSGTGYPVSVGVAPWGLAISPDGKTAWVTNTAASPGTVSVIDLTASPPSVSHTITVGTAPIGVSLTADGKYAYVVNRADGTVKAINTSSFTVVGTINVGTQSYALGTFIH